MPNTPDESHRHPTAAAIPVRTSPEVRVEQASDEDPDVFIEGVAFHDGLNQNAWGLTEQGARKIADSLVDADLTAGHPELRQGPDGEPRYDRPVHGGQGAPIGEVVTTEVVTTDEAMLRDGGYTARYTAQVLDPDLKQRYQAGLVTGDDYGVSVGIYGNPEAAVCSVCRDPMPECDHDRFEEVTGSPEGDGESDASDGEAEAQIAGPLYDDGESDHLASVFLPAYDGADANVATTLDNGEVAVGSVADGAVPSMAALAAAYDPPAEAAFSAETDTTAADHAGDDPDGESAWYRVAVDAASESDRTTVRF